MSILLSYLILPSSADIAAHPDFPSKFMLHSFIHPNPKLTTNSFHSLFRVAGWLTANLLHALEQKLGSILT
jgi:hypothetical protein